MHEKETLESLTDALFYSTTEGIIITNRAGEIIKINQSAEKMLGYNHDELLGEKVEMLVPKRVVDKHEGYRDGFNAHPKARSMGMGMDLYAVRKDQTEFPVEISLSYFKRGDENYVISFIIDITHRKKAENDILEAKTNLEIYAEELKMLHMESEQKVIERTAELAAVIKQLEITNDNLVGEMAAARLAREEKDKSQQIYFTIGENYPNGFIAVFNKNMEYVFIEGQLLKDLHISKEELLGKSFNDHFSSGYINYINQNFQKAFNGERTVFEMVFNDRYLQSYALPLADKNGQVNQVMLVTQDITERKKAVEEMSNALEKEKTLNELKSRFVSMASHEFRTPLGTILSSASLISKYKSEDDEDKMVKHVSRIKSAVENLTGILDDFLSISKLEEGKVNYSPSTVNIREICEEVKEEMQVTAKEGQDIIIQNNGTIETIVIDRHILKNILINLTSNAIKYSPENETVLIQTDINKSKFTIKVTDHGIGIPKEDQKHLFDTFFRAGNVSNIQGTGLGLNIVKKYVDLLGGTISFTSVYEKGTSFTIVVDIENLKARESMEPRDANSSGFGGDKLWAGLEL